MSARTREERIEALAALLRDAPNVDPPNASEGNDTSEDPTWLAFFLVRMAEETLHALRTEAHTESSLVRQLEPLLRDRPAADAAFGQLVIDAESVARRATVVASYALRAPGPIVALGDDDGVSIALALLGLPDVHAIDIDTRVLSFLRDASADTKSPIVTHRADVTADTVLRALHHEAAVVVTDPFRSAEDAAPFIAYGLAMLRREADAHFFLADHPDWSFEHEAIDRMVRAGGLSLMGEKRALHRYPLERAAFPRLAETAAASGASLEWFEALLALTSAYSNLFIYGRGGV